MNKNIRKITKLGKYTYSVSIPKEVIRDFGWKERQKVVISVNKKSKKITIEDWEK